MTTVFLRMLEETHDKGEVLRRAIQEPNATGSRQCFEVDPQQFATVPGSPFTYWVSSRLRGLFKKWPRFESDGRFAKQGLATADDFRFVRTWWEVPASKAARWFPFAKGGKHLPLYADVYLVVNWERDGLEISNFYKVGSDRLASRPQNTDYFLRPGLTWPLRTQSGLGMRAMPNGCIFAHKGPAAFVEEDSPLNLLALLAITISSSFRYLVELQMAFGSYEVGVIQRTPIPKLSNADVDALAQLARRGWSLKRRLDTMIEISHAFLLPPGMNERVIALDRAAIERELAVIRHKIDDLTFKLYGIGSEDRATIETLPKATAAGHDSAEEASINDPDDDTSEENDLPVGVQTDTLLSWFVGVAFGRFDKRIATGERAIPPEPEPFDPLPSRSPGMWPEGEPRAILPPEILVDDPGDAHDLVAHVTQASMGTGFDVPHDLRAWLAREFFPLHINMYSKSRRKAPIYWQLATPSASYSVWLYIHAFTRDTLYKVQNECAAPKLAHEERKLEALRKELGEDPRAAERKALAAQESFVEELRAFLDEVKRVAPLWNPDLDDGVIINFAPLWRLVPHHKPWQKELQATWDALCAGKYDWAHLAMHLWPERVVPKCATDRSLAIAHGLEDVFWLEDANGKWKPRAEPLRPVDELVRERTSPAVKAALQSLLDAPVAPARKASTRKKRAR